MPLIDCPECGHQISTAAEACPSCGHPNRPGSRRSSDLECYACSATATTRCQSCNVLSCALHLQNIYVTHGKGGSYELRCESCYNSAMMWKVVGMVFGGIVMAIALMLFLGRK